MDMNSNGPFPESALSAKSKSAPSLRRSCEACRASKGRCCPSKDEISRCQRCVRDRTQCIFLETKPRPKRVRTSKTRVAEMEQKLDGIFAMLSASNHNLPIKDVNVPNAPCPTPSSASDRNDQFLVQQPHTVMSDVQSLTSMAPIPSLWLKFDESQDVIGRGIISYDKAEVLLRGYGTHAPNFPFIVISPTVSLDSLRREKPFLLLSILTMTSTSNLPIQDLLETELRETLGRKVIFNGEKSLDLLQGLMIYVAWYHLFFRPDRQQIYQLSQMVIAMAVDLEISSSGTAMSGVLPTFAFEDSRMGNVRAHKFPSELEAMRTFLGCYYLSSYLSLAFRRPNNLKYTDYVDTCCQALTDAKETPSDYLLPYLIRLQRLAEEINTTFDYGGYLQLPSLDAIRIEMFLKTFRKQLKHFEDTFPADIWQNVAIRMACLYVSIYINEIGLHVTRPNAVKSIAAAQASCHEWYYATARTETLVTCIESAKKYLEVYLSLPKEDVFQNTIIEETKLVYAIAVIGRFTSGVDSPFLDASHLRETAKLGHYMSALIEHANEIITINGNGREHIDYFWHFRRIFQHTKNWFEEQVRGGFFTTLESNGLPDCLEFSFMEILEMETDPQYECPPEFLDAAPVEEDELWTVAMLEAWPTSTLDPRSISFSGGFQ